MPPDMENKPLSEQSKAVFSVISSRTCSSTDKFLAPELNEKFKAFLGILQQKLPDRSPFPSSWFFSTLSCSQSSEAIVPELNGAGPTAGMTIVPGYISRPVAGSYDNKAISIHVPVLVGFQSVQTSEHMLALGVFGLRQILGHINDADHLALGKADPINVGLLFLSGCSFSERLEKLYVGEIDLSAAKLIKMMPGNVNPASDMPLLLTNP